MSRKIQKQNICNAGEYYIASKLSAENFTVTITLGRAERYDILAVNPQGTPIKLSVKTRYQKNVSKFPLSKKDEQGGSKDFYYALVELNEFKKEPNFWIIPSRRINQIVKRAQQKWLKTRKSDKKHKESSIRDLCIKITKGNKKLYPKSWEKELKQYYKNIKQLKKI